jgi:phosphoribosyl 1,2-cyclic phosphodiesterase
MKATVWGCRGSLAAPGPDTVAYGGNTSCVQLELEDGPPVILDAGTGIRLLGLEFAATREPIHLCLTHLHLDHLEGLGFFVPIWQPERELHIWGPPSPVEGLEDRISRLFSPPIFPVPLSDVPASVHCHDLPDAEFELGSARILAQPVSHRGPTVGYRFEENGCSLAYIPDHEPYLGVEPDEVEPGWLSGFTIAAGAAVLLHDAQYFEDEYPSRVTFGHSSVAHAVAFARATAVERLILFHHDPWHSDEELRALEARARKLWSGNGHPPELAREGMTVALETTQDRCTPSVTSPR